MPKCGLHKILWSYSDSHNYHVFVCFVFGGVFFFFFLFHFFTLTHQFDPAPLVCFFCALVSPLLSYTLGTSAPWWTSRLGCWGCFTLPRPPRRTSCVLSSSGCLWEPLCLSWFLKSGLLFFCLKLWNQQSSWLKKKVRQRRRGWGITIKPSRKQILV